MMQIAEHAIQGLKAVISPGNARSDIVLPVKQGLECLANLPENWDENGGKPYLSKFKPKGGNPFTPTIGMTPPRVAGRDKETAELSRYTRRLSEQGRGDVVIFKTHLAEACDKAPRVLLVDEAHQWHGGDRPEFIGMCRPVMDKHPFFVVIAGAAAKRL